METVELSEIETRKTAYKIFSRLFYYPGGEIARLLYGGVIGEWLEHILPGKEAERLQSWVASRSSEADLLEALQVEYTHLFITAYPKLPAPLYKSYYTEKELFGADARNLMDIYQQYHFKVSPHMTEMPDHLAIILEFIYRLLEKEAGDFPLKDFAISGLTDWLPQLAKRIEENASLPFYPSLIRLLQEFIRNDLSLQATQISGA